MPLWAPLRETALLDYKHATFALTGREPSWGMALIPPKYKETLIWTGYSYDVTVP